MEIEKIEILKVSLKGYGFKEFDILVIPEEDAEGKTVSSCYLTKKNCALYFFMFGVYESPEEAAEMAYNAVPDYLPSFVAEILKEE